MNKLIPPGKRTGFEDLAPEKIVHITCDCVERGNYVLTLCGRMEPKDGPELDKDMDFEICAECQTELQFHTCDDHDSID